MGQNVQNIRLKSGLTQECLAELADIHPKTLGYMESGRRAISLTSFVKLVQYLQVDPADFFEGLPEPDLKKLKLIGKALERKRNSNKYQKQ